MTFSIRNIPKTTAVAAAFLFSSAMYALSLQAAAAADSQLEKSIQDGKALYSHETFGGNGKTCITCHVNGGVGPGKGPDGKAIPSLSNAAAIFPRFNLKANKVITLDDQVRNCIAGGVQGHPPAYGSEQVTQLVSYVSSLAQGKPLDMGGKPQ